MCLLFAMTLAITPVRSGKQQSTLTIENQKLLIQKDFLLAEKLDYEKKISG